MVRELLQEINVLSAAFIAEAIILICVITIWPASDDITNGDKDIEYYNRILRTLLKYMVVAIAIFILTLCVK